MITSSRGLETKRFIPLNSMVLAGLKREIRTHHQVMVHTLEAQSQVTVMHQADAEQVLPREDNWLRLELEMALPFSLLSKA
jgi:hypothetical protein